ncbi:uncharacterized protein LOC110038360 [Phalaenopsis equestris]|uniref:uncharacterized protein LOC110038360 n=1 Tax=Phalaenopsis equestris TaxID=78828 RepID=UPI0009E42012|nr:uncharacterized protein LOC110038360 [Phalaenopsis equestris]
MSGEVPPLKIIPEMEEWKEERHVKAPNLLARLKEEIEAVMHREKKHHKETHGMGDDICENTPIDNVKGPNLFERAKEEFEAIVDSIHSKKDHGHEHDGEKGTGC